MALDCVLSPRSAAALLALASACSAGPSVPLFEWASPGGGDWSDPSNWSPLGVPGVGEFLLADARMAFTTLQYVGISSSLTLRNLDVGPRADIYAVESIRLTGSLNLNGSMAFAPGANFTVERDAKLTGGGFNFWSDWEVFGRFENDGVIDSHGRLLLSDQTIDNPNVNTGYIDAGISEFRAGHFRNDGAMRVFSNATAARSFVNNGKLKLFAFASGETNFGELFRNSGQVFLTGNNRIEAERMVHDGAYEGDPNLGVQLRIFGNHTFTERASFDPTIRVTLDAMGASRTADGVLSTSANLLFVGGGWTLNGSFNLAGSSTLGEQPHDLVVNGELHVGRSIITGRSIVVRDSLVATNAVDLYPGEDGARFEGAFHAMYTLNVRGGSVEFLHHETSFGLSAVFEDASATFASSPTFSNLVVTALEGEASIATPDNRVVASGDITWLTRSQDLNTELVADGEIDLTVRRINAALTAQTVRLGGAFTDLNVDLTARESVIINGTNLSIGAVGDIAHRTIEGNLSTTFALPQAWDFDVVGSGARGAADSDTLTITGDATIYGRLRVRALGEVSDFRVGDEFLLFDAASVDALFRSVSLPELPEGLTFELRTDATSVRLLVVPAPGPVALALGIAGAACPGRRRRSPLTES